MANRTPLQIVNEQHGGKEKLVEKLVSLLERGDESKSEFRARLLAAANSKLLRLHSTMTEINERFGSTDKLVDSLLELMNKGKDKDYRDKVLTYTPIRLLGLHREAAKRARRGRANA